MSKKGRIKDEDKAVLNGTVDGVITKGNYTREVKGLKTTHTWIKGNEKFIMVFDYSITKNGPISMETIIID